MAHTSGKIKPGEIVDSRGRVLGKHEGIAFYTIGQREGLGIACGYPVYITKIDAKNNRITIGNKEEVHGEWFIVNNPHFIGSPIKKKIAASVKIRYNHKETPVEIIPFGKKIKVALKKPQFAVTPGQSAVFYNKDVVLGGGIINLK
jgi:tRNA-specific 2-thiouridylase